MVRVTIMNEVKGYPAHRGCRSMIRFTPGARRDTSLSLRHWVRISDQDPGSRGKLTVQNTILTLVDYFDEFDKHGPSVMEFSQFEYDQHLVDPAWSLEETNYLFDMLRSYNLRFIVVADRYEYNVTEGVDLARGRTVEVSEVTR